MLFKYATAASLLTFCSLSSAAIPKYRRSTSTVSLYGYGGAMNGDPVFYADGLAYVGLSAPTGSTTATNITFSSDFSSTTTAWTINSNSSAVSFNQTLSMYIDPTSGSFSQVGFAANSSVPSGAVTTGFTFFGSSVSYVVNSTDYELQFWANETDSAGVFALYWNAGTALSGAFPVTLKTTPPVTL